MFCLRSLLLLCFNFTWYFLWISLYDIMIFRFQRKNYNISPPIVKCNCKPPFHFHLQKKWFTVLFEPIYFDSCVIILPRLSFLNNLCTMSLYVYLWYSLLLKEGHLTQHISWGVVITRWNITSDCLQNCSVWYRMWIRLWIYKRHISPSWASDGVLIVSIKKGQIKHCVIRADKHVWSSRWWSRKWYCVFCTLVHNE